MMNARRLRFLAPALLLLLLAHGGVALADLALDPGFAGDGIATVNLSPEFDLGSGIAVQPADQKLVVVGVSEQATGPDFFSYAVVARFLPDGSLDPAFGTGGTVALLPGPPVQPDGGADAIRVALQVDGKIVVAGTFDVNDGTSDRQLLLLRLNPDGSLDPSFGAGGVLILDPPGAPGASPEALALQSDGKILVSGGVPDGPGFMLRLDSTGAYDPAFDGDGVALITNPVAPADGFSLNAFAIVTGGSIIAVGGGPDVVLVDLTSGGQLGTGFGGDGIASINVSSGFGVDSFDVAADLAVLADGRILVSGVTVADLNVGNGNALLLRTTPEGVLDTTYGFDGFAPIADQGDQERALALALLPSGDSVVAGTGIKPTQVSAGGKLAVPLAGDFTPSLVADFALQANGAIVGAGRQTVLDVDTELVAVRLLATAIVEPDLTPDPFSFEPQTNVETLKLVISNPATITGIDGPVPISISGGTGDAGGTAYGIGCGDISTYTTLPGTINPGQTVCVGLATPGENLRTVVATLRVGGVAADFSVTTGNATPDPFSFPSRTGVRLQSVVVSAPAAITGLTVAAPICIESLETPGTCAGVLEDIVSQYSINCTGTFTAAPGRISPGDTVCVRHRASSLLDDRVTTTLRIGTVSASFTSTTQTGEPLPGASAFDGWFLLLLPALGLRRRRRG